MPSIAVAAAAAFEPSWRFPDQPNRLVFETRGGVSACALVTIPSRPGAVVSAQTAFAACEPDGTLLRHQLVHADSMHVDLLVGLGSNTGLVEYAVYYGGSTPAASQPEPMLRDVMPVRLEVYKSTAPNLPTAWPKMFYLFSHAGAPQQVAHFTNLGKLELMDPPPGEKKPNDRSIARLTSFLLCPADGTYRFALSCRDAGFVLVDGAPVAAWPGEHNAGEWKTGPPVSLSTGPHRLEVFNLCRSPFTVDVGWSVPGSETVAPIPQTNLLTAREPADTRLETLGKEIQPNFTFTILPAYSFRGRPEVFVPVKLVNATRGGAGALRCRWRFGSGPDEEGDSVTHVFSSMGQHKVALEIRDGTQATGIGEKTVDSRRSLPRQYAMDCELIDLPAVCFPEDMVSPQLRLTGSLPPNETVEAVWTIRDRSGGTKASSKVVILTGQQVCLPLIRTEAKSLLSVEWHVKHHGVDLGAGTVKFLTPPFEELPARVDGDRLFGGTGNQIVLVPGRHSGSFKQGSIAPRQVFGKILCVDDFLVVAGQSNSSPGVAFGEKLARVVDGKKKPMVGYRALSPWDASPDAYGPLLKLVQAPAAVDGDVDVVVLSLGLRDLGELKDVAVFERHAAALSDILAASMKRPVVWVTPPPYPGHGAGARAFAAAIRRVADARGMPVVDLYTTFSGMRSDVRPFVSRQDTVLSEEGQGLAAQMIARTLLQE